MQRWKGGVPMQNRAEREAMCSRRSGGVPRENRRPANIRIEEGAYRAPHPLLEKLREWNWCRIILCVAAIYALSGIGLKLITIVSQKHKQAALLEQQAALEQQVEGHWNSRRPMSEQRNTSNRPPAKNLAGSRKTRLSFVKRTPPIDSAAFACSRFVRGGEKRNEKCICHRYGE